MLVPPALNMPDVPLVRQSLAQGIAPVGSRAEEIPENNPVYYFHAGSLPVILGRWCWWLYLLGCWLLLQGRLLSNVLA
jgi:hypothetical protein